MNRQSVLAGLSTAILAASSVMALAVPCGPAGLSEADGKALVNRGVGLLDGKPGMPLAVGDHEMLRSGSAEILFVNGTGSALACAKSTTVTACSAGASRLTNPALALGAVIPSGNWSIIAPNSQPNIILGRNMVRSSTATAEAESKGLNAGALLGIGGSVAALAIAAGAATSSRSSDRSTIVSILPASPISV